MELFSKTTKAERVKSFAGKAEGRLTGFLHVFCPLSKNNWKENILSISKRKILCLLFFYLQKFSFAKHCSFPYCKLIDIGITWLKWHCGEGHGTPLQYSCLENPMDGGAWWAAVHGVVKSRTRLSDFPFTFHFHALEKEMATHSSVLAWTIPGTGKPGGQPSRGSHRVGHNGSNLAAAAAFIT